MLRSPVNATSLPGSVSDARQDECVRVIDPSETYPPNWICSLVITDTNGNQCYGSGFKIHIPKMNCCIVVTSGHCVYVNGGYADNISVTFPGQAAVTATQEDLYAPLEYRNDSNADYDYGIIILPGNSDEGFGWSAIVPDDQLSQHVSCQWVTGGKITNLTDDTLYYMNDIKGDPSGNPVYTWYNRYWTVVGVQSYGNLNSAPRITSDMIRRFLECTQNLKKYSLQSSEFPNIYLRCDGDGVDSAATVGGTINGQYKPPSDWETFYIYPVEVSSSLAVEQAYIVALQNCHWKDILVRMDGSSMTKYENEGGGVVNCQWIGKPTGPLESFFLEIDPSSGAYSFRSVQSPHCYIRLDGRKINSYRDEGGGRVNCQYYDKDTEKKGPRSWEQFHLKEQPDLVAKL